MVIIPQGKPTPGYFIIAYPPNKPKPYNETIVCKHPKSGVETIGKCVAVFSELWNTIPDSLCLIAYGICAKELRDKLAESFPDFRDKDEINFLLIKELKKQANSGRNPGN